MKHTTDMLELLIEKFRGPLAGSDTEFEKCLGLFQEIDDRTIYARRIRGEDDIDPESFLKVYR